jgi:four helix bundle protein
MRDHSKLEAFALADTLALDIYRITRSFPAEERYGVTAQLRRAAISIPANIVEGSARRSEREYLHFLSIAYGSAKELQYELSLCRRLGYLSDSSASSVEVYASRTARAIWGLISGLQRRHPSP